MKVLGFSFTKLSGERLKGTGGQVKVNTEIDFPEIKHQKSEFLNTKDEIIEAKFSYKVNYDPDLAKIVVEGRVIIAVDSKTANDIVKQWTQKKMPDSFRTFLVNIVMRKSTLKSLNLCDELNLPVNVPIPTLKQGKN